jgi:TolB-like protein
MRALAPLLVCILVSTAASAAERQKLAVLDLEAKGVDKQKVETLTDIVTVALKKLGVFEVISRADIQQMLNFEESKQLVGCTTSSSCVAEIGGALGVARVITGSVGQIGKKYVITLSLIDTKSAKVLERESRDVENEEYLVGAAENGSRFLVRSLLESRQGEVILKVSETNAEVEIDGKLIGLSPLPRLKLASGPHTVRVSKKGFVTYARDVVVDEKQASVQEVTLIPSVEFIADYDKTANGVRVGAYLATGVGVALIATAVGLRVGLNDPRARVLENEIKAYEAGGTQYQLSAEGQAQAASINSRIGPIEQIDALALGFIVGGSVAVVAGVVMFFVGPKPGIYDAYKTVSVGDGKLSFDFAPTKGGGFGTAKLSF